MSPARVTPPATVRRTILPLALNAAFGVVGLCASLVGLWVVQPLQFNVVTYEAVRQPTSGYLPPFLLASVLFVGTPILSFALCDASAFRNRVGLSIANLRPMLLGAPLAAFALSELTPPFLLVLALILGFGFSAYLAASRTMRSADVAATPEPRVSARATSMLAGASLVALILLLTVIHTRIQINFFDHFMLGHADIGHFTEELKNALAGRGLRSDSFDNTRLGWHFVPLMYALAPGYALWPSPVYLMVCGAFVLHVPALIVFWFARKRTDSILDGWLFATAWLLLPSISRLIYSNTYGFAWLYVSVPILAFLLAAAEWGRWKACWLTLAVLLLCRETNAAVTLGFGIYLTLFSARRKAGVVVVVVSVGYALLCATVLIPYFAAAGRYERLDLFGDLGNSLPTLLASPFTHPGVFWGRLLRPQGWNLLLLLVTTLYFLPFRGWRLSLACLPTLLPILLFQNPEWSSIKFWHHALILPFLFFAGLTVLPPGIKALQSSVEHKSPMDGARADRLQLRSRGIALASIVCAAWGHYFFGFSPLSKSYEVIAGDAFLQQPDPRLEIINRLRDEIPRSRTVLATERMAAHFTDYRRIYTGRRVRPADLVVIDRSDSWDTSDLPKRAAEFGSDPDYAVRATFGSVIVFERRADAPPATPD